MTSLQDLRAFQDEFTQFLSGVQVEPLHGDTLETVGALTVLEGMVISTAQTTPTRCFHLAAGTGSDDAVVFMGAPAGNLQLQAQGQEWRLGVGDAIFTVPGRHRVETHVPTQLCGVMLSRSLLGSLVGDVDAGLWRPLRAHPATALLTQYACLLRDQDAAALALPELRRAAVLHMHDLAALLIGATGDAAQLARGRGVAAARLLAVRQDIAAHHADPGLSVADVARRQGVTPRHVQALLEEAGETFTALVLAHRLASAHHLLTDARLARRTVSAIALDAGFGDLSYFNRSFRRRYGMTPTEARAAGRDPGGGHPPRR
ncbi:helix-turn-helix transcriptional regulator [Comamonas serinivorans]|nr:AraC family transcriptional regulator [Comamonas serinivorans]